MVGGTMFGYWATGRNATAAKSEHHDEDIDDRGEPRMINEEVREFHDPTEPRF